MCGLVSPSPVYPLTRNMAILRSPPLHSVPRARHPSRERVLAASCAQDCVASERGPLPAHLPLPRQRPRPAPSLHRGICVYVCAHVRVRVVVSLRMPCANFGSFRSARVHTTRSVPYTEPAHVHILFVTNTRVCTHLLQASYAVADTDMDNIGVHLCVCVCARVRPR